MPYTKRIVCLANSRKFLGRCLAGREFSDGEFGEWIRPVSGRPDQEISVEERHYENGQDPQLLDIISIRMREHRPDAHQTENHLIDSEHYWRKVGTASWDDLDEALDDFDGQLWIDGFRSTNGINDRIPEAQAAGLGNSLKLVEVDDLEISVAREYHKRKVRARFRLGANNYLIAVTDPVIESEYLARDDGRYPVGLARLCISVGELLEGYCYKLVAGVIRPEE